MFQSSISIVYDATNSWNFFILEMYSFYPWKSQKFLNFGRSGRTVSDIKASDTIWVLSRFKPTTTVMPKKQTVPSWGGWICLTEDRHHERNTTVEYMPPIMSPIITANATVRHILKISQEFPDVSDTYSKQCFRVSVRPVSTTRPPRVHAR